MHGVFPVKKSKHCYLQRRKNDRQNSTRARLTLAMCDPTAIAGRGLVLVLPPAELSLMLSLSGKHYYRCSNASSESKAQLWDRIQGKEDKRGRSRPDQYDVAL